MPKNAFNTEGRNAARQAALDEAANAAAGGAQTDEDEELDGSTISTDLSDDNSQTDGEQTGGESTREARLAAVQKEIDEGAEQADEAAVLDELESKDEITAEDLRRLPGADDYSDEELLALWEKTESGETGEPLKLEGFKLYSADGAEITDPAGISALDLLTGKVQIGYNALNKEHRKALRDLARVASLGHLNERNMTQRTGERDSALGQLRTAKQRVAELEQYQKLWTYAMTAYGQGNDAPMKQLLETYNKALLSPGSDARSTAAPEAETAEGQRLYYETIVPRARELAAKYNVDERDVADTISILIDREPPEFLDWQKIEQIIGEQVPQLIEEYLANSATNSPSETELLRKEVGELKAQLANKQVESVRNKRRNAPVAGGGRRRSSESTGDEIVPSTIKTREQAKEWLRS